mgnify:CR=1 FL=1
MQMAGIKKIEVSRESFFAGAKSIEIILIWVDKLC